MHAVFLSIYASSFCFFVCVCLLGVPFELSFLSFRPVSRFLNCLPVCWSVYLCLSSFHQIILSFPQLPYLFLCLSVSLSVYLCLSPFRLHYYISLSSVCSQSFLRLFSSPSTTFTLGPVRISFLIFIPKHFCRQLTKKIISLCPSVANPYTKKT